MQVRNKVKLKITEGRCGFVEEKVTTKAIYILRAIFEQALEVQKEVYLCFVDSTQEFDKSSAR